jgi:hypothetical protein
MSTHIVSAALKYYDTNNEKYYDLKKKMVYARRVLVPATSIELAGYKIVFSDENKNDLFMSRIEIIAAYFNSMNTWVWGWALATIDKAIISTIAKVHTYGINMEVRNDINNAILRNELITSRFSVSNQTQIDIHCAIASYLSKKPFIFVWRDFSSHEADEYVKIKGEFDLNEDERTDISFYMIIIDPPEL